MWLEYLAFFAVRVRQWYCTTYLDSLISFIQNVPVARGCSAPFEGRLNDSTHVMGNDGLGLCDFGDASEFDR